MLKVRRLGVEKNGRFIPNGACVLLFANDPQDAFPGAKIRFLRFEGEHEGTGAEWNAVQDRILEGPIPDVIMSAANALGQQLRTFQRLGPDGRFTPMPEYPRDAWYEAIVNACCHRSYGRSRTDRCLSRCSIIESRSRVRVRFLSTAASPPPNRRRTSA
jgi:ATP-dependent DNA helicase RecG